MTYQLSERAMRVRQAIASRPVGAIMTPEEINHARLITRSMRCIPVGRTALNELKIPGIPATLHQYSVMVIDDETFDIFGKDLPNRCFELKRPDGRRMKIYGDRMLSVHSYDPTFWDGRKVIPTVEQVFDWFKKNPLFYDQKTKYELEGTLTKYCEMKKEPWFTPEHWDFYISSRYFDTYYDYSDDAGVYRAGRKRHEELTALYNALSDKEDIEKYVKFSPLK